MLEDTTGNSVHSRWRQCRYSTNVGPTATATAGDQSAGPCLARRAPEEKELWGLMRMATQRCRRLPCLAPALLRRRNKTAGAGRCRWWSGRPVAEPPVWRAMAAAIPGRRRTRTPLPFPGRSEFELLRQAPWTAMEVCSSV